MNYEEIPMDRRYSVNALCTNCGYLGKVDLLKGTMVSDKECHRCECKSLERQDAPQKKIAIKASSGVR